MLGAVPASWPTEETEHNDLKIIHKFDKYFVMIIVTDVTEQMEILQ